MRKEKQECKVNFPGFAKSKYCPCTTKETKPPRIGILVLGLNKIPTFLKKNATKEGKPRGAKVKIWYFFDATNFWANLKTKKKVSIMFDHLDHQTRSMPIEFMSYPPNSNANISRSALEVRVSVFLNAQVHVQVAT